MQACPLGALYLSIVYSYALLVKHADREVQTRHSETVSTMLRAFPILVIAGSRWPVYEALHHFSGFHGPVSQRSSAVLVCQGQSAKSASGIDWGQLQKHATLFCNQGMLGLEPGQGSVEHTLPHTHTHTPPHTHTHPHTPTHTHTHTHTHTLADRSSRGMPFARLHMFILVV